VNVVARRVGVDLRESAGTAFGTFGELLQGGLPDGADFLVTLPINRLSTAWFRLDPGGPLRVYPSHKSKSQRLAETMLNGAGGTLVIDGDLPVGKGLASSSADLVATARAVGGALGLDTRPAALEDWLRPIEPTDGVMYPGVVAFEHRRVRLRSFVGALPPLTVVALDEGGQFDTVAFNHLPKPYTAADRHEYARLLDTVTAAIRTGDLAAVGAVATRSAQLNQRLVPKRNLDVMIAICQAAGGLGVACAHSGTMIGILLADGQPGHAHRLARVRAACAALPGAPAVFRSYVFPEVALDHAV
jgi:L-threonine kinase